MSLDIQESCRLYTSSRLQGSAIELHRGWAHTPQGVGEVTAVVLLVIEQPKLPAVVAAAHQLAPAPGVTIIAPAVTGPVTVALAKAARLLRGTASLTVKISSCTSLT